MRPGRRFVLTAALRFCSATSALAAVAVCRGTEDSLEIVSLTCVRHA